MASPVELARLRTDLDNQQLAHLQRLVRVLLDQESVSGEELERVFVEAAAQPG